MSRPQPFIRPDLQELYDSCPDNDVDSLNCTILRLSSRQTWMDSADYSLRNATTIALTDNIQKELEELLIKLNDLMERNAGMLNCIVEEDDEE